MNLKKLKQLRKIRGYTLADMAKKTGYTASFLSQIERGLKQPSLDALRKISECLDVPLINFFIEEHNEMHDTENNMNDSKMCSIIHKNNREKFVVPEILTEYELLTPSTYDFKNKEKLTGLFAKINPGCWISEKMISHNFDETVYVIKGNMEAHIGKDIYTLEEGDSLYIGKNAHHNLFNSGDDILVCISFISTNFFNI